MKQTLKYILSVVMENLKYAESKHSVALALSSGIIIFISSNLNTGSRLGTAFAWVSIILCAISIGFSFLALMSRNIKVTKRRGAKRPENTNLSYFKDISEYGVNNYLSAIIERYEFPDNYKPDGFEIDLAKQILINAKVTNLKFEFFNKSIRWLMSGVIFTVVMVAIIAFGG
jgi:hypothetical protein